MTFHDCTKTEKKGLERLRPALVALLTSGVLLDTNTLLNKDVRKEVQIGVGDILVGYPDGTIKTIEVKIEERNTGNFFAETWSNFPHRPGWVVHSRADWLVYVFLDSGDAYAISMPVFKETLRTNFTKYREVGQKKHRQTNISRGMLMPVGDVPSRKFSV